MRQYNPPPNPAKETDSRFADYLSKFGDESWELDALNPDILAKLVADALREVMDSKRWAKAVKREKEARTELGLIAEFYGPAVEAAKEAKGAK